MTLTTEYDAIVIGAGQAGGPLATTLARAGWKTALIERVHAGGTCVNEGCTPTKTMVASARVAYLARRSADYGVQTGAISIDMKKIRQRKRDIVESFRMGSQHRIEQTEGVNLLIGEASFTHISYDDFRILRANLLDGGSASTYGRLVPYTVFIDPQPGRIGLSETEAREQGWSIRVARMPMNYVARALETDESRGFMKVVVDAETGQLLGAAILGIEGGEIMAMLEIAMLGRVPYTILRDAVFAHPTLAESLNNLFSTLDA